MTLDHSIPPVFDKKSKILILGSFPSVKSRETGFFYGHPRNRFWRVLAAILGEGVPSAIDEKKTFLLRNHIGLWDVCARCDIEGSKDSSIKNVVPNDIASIVAESGILAVYINGSTAGRLYKQLIAPKIDIEYTILPSTSPLNAAYNIERLIDEWSVIKEYLNTGE